MLFIAIFSSGCGENVSEMPQTPLRIALEAAPTSFDPRFAADADSSRISGLVHCSLVEPDDHGGWSPALASSWSQPGESTWIFELRNDAWFHDGTPVTVADVVATYRSVLDPRTSSPKRGALGSVTGVVADGASRVRFELSAPNAALLDGATIGILPAAVASGPRNDDTASRSGCGPYRVESSGSHSLVLRAATTWLRGPVTLETIEFRVVPDAVMRTLELENGDLDFVQNALEPDAAKHLTERRKDTLRVSITPYDAYQYLGINHRHPALGDVRVRRAIAHAIDRDAIVRHVLGGQAEAATGLVPPHHAGYEPRVRRYAHDPERARQLLDAAGYRDPDGDGPLPRLRLRYTTSTVELRRRIAEVLAAELAEVGIELSIESYEWGTFFQDIARGDYDLYSLAWIGIRDLDLFRVVFHSKMAPPAGNNRGFFANARIDRLTERGQQEIDPVRRREIYARLQRATARTLPYVPMWWPKNVVVTSRRLEGFTPHPAGDLAGLANARLVEP